MRDKKSQSSVTLDIDSTVRGVYGKQEGAEKGFNSIKKGQRSYHPLLTFVSETNERLALMPRQIKKVFLRADSGFF